MTDDDDENCTKNSTLQDLPKLDCPLHKNLSNTVKDDGKQEAAESHCVQIAPSVLMGIMHTMDDSRKTLHLCDRLGANNQQFSDNLMAATVARSMP